MTISNPQSLYQATGGASSTSPLITMIQNRDPLATDINYPLLQKWYNSISEVTWQLDSFSSAGGTVSANWVSIGYLSLPLIVANGGTGKTSFVPYAPITGGTTATGPLQSADTGFSNVGYVFTSTGSTSEPTWQPSAGGTVPAAGVVTSNGTSFASVASTTPGQILQSTSTAAAPAFSTATYPSTTTVNNILYSSATNTVGQITSANNGVLITSNVGVPSLLANSGTAGYVLTSNTGAPPSWQAQSYVGFVFTDVTGTSQAISPNNGYVADNSSLVTLTLPTTAAFGTLIYVSGRGAGGWQIAQNASQIIYLGKQNTTAGVTGYLASTYYRDQVQLLCTSANTEWTVIGSVGNITYN